MTITLNTLLRTAVFDAWLIKLGDSQGKARIIDRIRSAERGHFGDCASVGQGVSEMRVHAGPGYRVYFTRIGAVVYILLSGGTKRGQARDIAKAQEMASKLTEV